MKILKWILIVVVGLVVVLGTGLVVAVYALEDRKWEASYPNIQASTDSAVIARGQYLIYGPAHCAHCHGAPGELERVEKGEMVPLSGGFAFNFPFGKIYTPNITPHETGIGRLSDKEIARTLRHGVRSDGKALIDFMPFYDISDEDLTAIISFLRAQPPVEHNVPKTEMDFIGKAIMAFIIKPMGDSIAPATVAQDTTAAYGEYLAVSVANCRGCHTPRDMMTGLYIGEDFSGGTKFEVMDAKGVVTKGKHYVTPNLTPDAETGRMTGWSKEQFIARFRQGRTMHGSVMPWGPFSRLTDGELTAIYHFLKSVKPVKQEIPLGMQDGDPM